MYHHHKCIYVSVTVQAFVTYPAIRATDCGLMIRHSFVWLIHLLVTDDMVDKMLTIDHVYTKAGDALDVIDNMMWQGLRRIHLKKYLASVWFTHSLCT